MSKRNKPKSAPTAAHDVSRSREVGAGDNGLPAWVAAIVLAIAIGVAYGPALYAPLIFDDHNTVIDNETIRSLWPLVGTVERPGPLNPAARQLSTASRPIVNLSLAVNYHFGSLQPVGYHLVNLVIHFGSAMLLFAVTRRALKLPYFAGRYKTSAGWLAFAVAMLWSLHPLQTEAVIYITQRTELMMAFFYLATLYCSLRYWAASEFLRDEARPTKVSEGAKHRYRTLWLTLAIAVCLCGMGSKEVMVSAPLVVLLFERTFVSGSAEKSLQRSWPLYVGLASTWFAVLIFSLGAPHGESAGFGHGVSGPDWWLTQSKVFWMYLKLVLWPWPLLIHYQFPYLTTFASAWMYVVPLVALVFLVLVLLWHNRPAGFLGIAVFAILSPTFFVPIVTEMAAERRMYLPLAALVVLLVVGGYQLANATLRQWLGERESLNSVRSLRMIAASLVVVVCLAFVLGASKRAAAYHDTIGLWQDVVRFQPDDFMAHDNLGLILTRADRLPEAERELRAAVALRPDYFNAHNNLGSVFVKLGDYPKAVDSFQAAVEIDPSNVMALNNLGIALMRSGRLPEAIERFGQAVQLQPNNAEAHNNLGNALTRSGNFTDAIKELRASLSLSPDDAFTLNNLSNALMLSGNYAEALEYLEDAVRLQPDHADFHNNFGIALSHTARLPEAIEHFGRALELDRQYADAHYNLAVALLNTKQIDEAIPHLQQVADNPKYIRSCAVLVRALVAKNRSEDAVAAAQKGVAVARAAGLNANAEELENWLKQHGAALDGGSKPAIEPVR